MWLRYVIRELASPTLTVWILKRGMLDLELAKCVKWATLAGSWPVIHQLLSRISHVKEQRGYIWEYVAPNVRTIQMAQQTLEHPLMADCRAKAWRLWQAALEEQNVPLLDWLHQQALPYHIPASEKALRNGLDVSVRWLLQHNYLMPSSYAFIHPRYAVEMHQRGMRNMDFIECAAKANDLSILQWGAKHAFSLQKREKQITCIIELMEHGRTEMLQWLLVERGVPFLTLEEAEEHKIKVADFATFQWLLDHTSFLDLRDQCDSLSEAAAVALDVKWLQSLRDQGYLISLHCAAAIIEATFSPAEMLDDNTLIKVQDTLDWFWKQGVGTMWIPQSLNWTGKLVEILTDSFLAPLADWLIQHHACSKLIRDNWAQLSEAQTRSMVHSIVWSNAEKAAHRTLDWLMRHNLWGGNVFYATVFSQASTVGCVTIMQLIHDRGYSWSQKVLQKLILDHRASKRTSMMHHWAATHTPPPKIRPKRPHKAAEKKT